MGKQWKQWLTLLFGALKSLQMVIAALKLKDAYSLEGKLLTKLDSILKSRDITLSTKVHLIKALTVKRLSTMWETQVRSLCWEDPLEKEMAIQ